MKKKIELTGIVHDMILIVHGTYEYITICFLTFRHRSMTYMVKKKINRDDRVMVELNKNQV